MNEDLIFTHYTDIISDYQNVFCWGFDTAELSKLSAGDYSRPVRYALFRAFKELANSMNKNYRFSRFTVFGGDCGPSFEFFSLAVSSKISSRIIDVLGNAFREDPGFIWMEGGSIPSTPLMPLYRYDRGLIVQYVYDDNEAGKRKIDTKEEFDSGLTVLNRLWVSAEGLDLQQKYANW